MPGERYADLPEAERERLPRRVRTPSPAGPYIARHRGDPTHHLRARGGFDNLEQAGRMFSVDVGDAAVP